MLRELEGRSKLVAQILCIALALFILYVAYLGAFTDLRERSIYLLLALPLTFILYKFRPGSQKTFKIPLWELIPIILAVAACVNAFIKEDVFVYSVGLPSKGIDLFFGCVLLILSLEAARRTIGWSFPILAILFTLYGLLGPYFPGMWGHPGFSLATILQFMYQTTEGIWGFITGLGCRIVGMFLVFGALLASFGAASTFGDLALLVAGRRRGGAAQVACFSSGLMGMISGSSSANVAMTGNFSIPLMKRLKYKPYFAGGVESAASTAGQYTPPVMGAGAFVMAEMLGISYLDVAAAAMIPALLFYLGCMFAVRCEAYRLDLQPVPISEIPHRSTIFKWARIGPLFCSVFLLIFLAVRGQSVVLSCFYAAMTLILLHILSDFSPLSMKQRIENLLPAIAYAGQAVVSMTSLLVCANIVIGLVSQTGLGVKLTMFITNFGGQSLLFALGLGAMTCMILGMGIPTTGAYILSASIVWPALNMLGVEGLPGNLFLFIFACISAITPPVCAAVFVAAPMAQANWIKVAWVAIKLSLPIYIIPFLFVYNPAIVLIGEPLQIVHYTLTALAGVIFFTAGIWGYFIHKLFIPDRILMFLGGLGLIIPGLETDLLGLGLVAVGQLVNYFLYRRAKST
jgi:TRAP transporter 4TM/12TM fusion protein